MKRILSFRSDFAAVKATSRAVIWAMVTWLAVALRPITGVFCIQTLSSLEKTRSDPVRILKSFLKALEP